MAKQYLDYEGLQRLVENINKKYAPISAIVFKSTVDDIAHLPAVATQKAGWMYNIKTGGLTTDDFVEGAGHIVADGENIAAVELIVGSYTPVGTIAPDDDPKALGWYEILADLFAPVTPVGDEDPSAENWYEFTVESPVGGEDPKTLGWYELDGSNYVLSEDTTVDPLKTYASGAVSADTSVQAKTYYKEEITYQLSQDRLPVAGKAYFTADTVMKWDLMGGVFDLEDRYLEFGDEFPQGPASRMVDGRTYLYMGETKKVYTRIETPEGRPASQGYFELDSATAIVDPSIIYNPKEQVLYEQKNVDPSDPTSAVYYERSADVTYDNTKTYYDCAFVASADTTVDPAKIYYSEADAYKKAVIYQYDATNKDWIAQSNGGTDDMVRITEQEIDDLFI